VEIKEEEIIDDDDAQGEIRFKNSSVEFVRRSMTFPLEIEMDGVKQEADDDVEQEVPVDDDDGEPPSKRSKKSNKKPIIDRDTTVYNERFAVCQ
jgi:hypothetical protein